ncbi:DUF262 domain-containing protein [Cognataquiflexum aquatile]|uniref:DUF262 domain-containing protein n=1 Tax=Cognataquiflexum aquatile TaxID=2249427 RepID=UPI000DE90B9F|nr:DUF262 domain-containing protein [Cognataquiflexum aquatile]
MKVENKDFSIEEVCNLKSKIDPKPQYQRTQVWKIDRKRLLIDSIMRGYDLPKFYLNKIPFNSFFDFEVCDGQQRLRTIWEFYEDKFSIGKDLKFEDENLDGLKFSELPEKVQIFFLSYKLTITTIIESKSNEIRDLFARLQKGMGLNQAELRRALSTQIGSYVESIVDNHRFFKECGFPNLRNKHQDYIDHVISYFVNGFNLDMKGIVLQDVYIKISPYQATQYVKELSLILDAMEKINSYSKGIFKNKWAFVDSFILLFQNKHRKVDFERFKNRFLYLENKRKEYRGNPKSLIEKEISTDFDKRLYDYILAFSKDGNLKANLKKRNTVFDEEFKHVFFDK